MNREWEIMWRENREQNEREVGRITRKSYQERRKIY